MTNIECKSNYNNLEDHSVIVTAYTDGACKGNPGVGGWGWVCWEAKNNKSFGSVKSKWEDYGGLDKTTNNQMELQAMAELLEFCKLGITAEIYSDSSYVLQGILGKKPESLMIVNIKSRGWMYGWSTSKSVIGATYSSNYWNKTDIKNGLEWYRIHQSLLKHAEANSVLKFCWVKGHSGVEGNEIADVLSNKYCKEHPPSVISITVEKSKLTFNNIGEKEKQILSLIDAGYSIKVMNMFNGNPIQIRINDFLDIYTTTLKYHSLKTNTRGHITGDIKDFVDNLSKCK